MTVTSARPAGVPAACRAPGPAPRAGPRRRGPAPPRRTPASRSRTPGARARRWARSPGPGTAADSAAPAAAPATAPASPARAARAGPRSAARPRARRTAPSSARPDTVSPIVLPRPSTGTTHQSGTSATATTSATITSSQPATRRRGGHPGPGIGEQHPGQVGGQAVADQPRRERGERVAPAGGHPPGLWVRTAVAAGTAAPASKRRAQPGDQHDRAGGGGRRLDRSGRPQRRTGPGTRSWRSAPPAPRTARRTSASRSCTGPARPDLPGRWRAR